ncbi:MAG: DUF1861 family protein [Tepidisphaeraceae bacterium]|jgi:uncharacterized protein DUF1861
MAEFAGVGESDAQKQEVSTVYRTLTLEDQPRSCSDLLSALHVPSHMETHALEFEQVDGRDVYNITAPFRLNGKTLLIGRVEKRDTEISEIVVFEKARSNGWTPCFTHSSFQGLQDPCVTWAGDELVLGGVRFPVPLEKGGYGCVMEFYRGSSLEGLRHFLSGPLGMKDIRFKQLPDGRVAIFSRPQGAVGGRGKIGFTIAPSWDAITAEMIARATLFKGQWLKEEWGGVNEAHQLANGQLGVLGHIACFDGQGNRHYYPMAFAVDLRTRQPSAIRIIARRSFFPPGSSKRPDLVDVVFSGGIIRNGDGTANLYAGTSDTAAAVVKLPDPFLQFET